MTCRARPCAYAKRRTQIMPYAVRTTDKARSKGEGQDQRNKLRLANALSLLISPLKGWGRIIVKNRSGTRAQCRAIWYWFSAYLPSTSLNWLSSAEYRNIVTELLPKRKAPPTPILSRPRRLASWSRGQPKRCSDGQRLTSSDEAMNYCLATQHQTARVVTSARATVGQGREWYRYLCFSLS